MKKSYYITILIILLAVAVWLPFGMNKYIIRQLTSLFMFAALAVSWNIITGKSGYFSFGHGAFFGIGAYATAILMLRLHLPFWISFLGGGLAATLFAFLVGLPILRLKGHYFAIITLGLAEVMHGLALNLEGLTGGGVGLSLPIKSGSIDEIYSFFYFLMFAILIAALLTSFLIDRTRFGHGLVAIREDEVAARVLGVNTTLYKIAAYAFSAVFCGLAGGAYAYWMTFIEPMDVFGLPFSINIVIMALLGGTGTLWGPVIGAFLFELISELIWSHFLTFHSFFLGIFMILIIYLLPKGFMELIQSRRTLSFSSIINNLKTYSE